MAVNARGFSLLELAIGLLVASVTAAVIVTVAASAASAWAYQDNLGAVQERARIALDTLAVAIREAGYDDATWAGERPLPAALLPATAENVDGADDRLAVQGWSDRNCLGSANPVSDGAGRPAFHLRQQEFFVRDGHLATVCRYGPDAGSLTTQVNGLALVAGIEALEVALAVDDDGDRAVDRFTAAIVGDEAAVRGVRLDLAVASPGAAGVRPQPSLDLGGRVHTGADDARIRRAFSLVVGIRGRL